MKGKIRHFFKKSWFLTAFFAILAVITSWCASMVQNSGYSVKVTKGVADIDETYSGIHDQFLGRAMTGNLNAKLAYQLYIPKGVDADHPAPAVALTHGYLNSKEFEEAPAIELAKRGYVVMAFDQYDHGDSTWDTPAQFNFYVWSAYDAVNWLYEQPYVLKDEDGNGMIAVSGHSMGGFGSELAVAWDEMAYQGGRANYRKICAALAVGADFRYDDDYVKGYAAYCGATYNHTYDTYNGRTVGTIAGQYDEFFFDNSGKSAGTVIEKDYLSDSVGKAMLGGLSKAGENGHFYQTTVQNRAQVAANGGTNVGIKNEVTDLSDTFGERVIYVVSGDHPYNTWSMEATEKMVNFYHHAFQHQLLCHGLSTVDTYVSASDGSHQSWYWKEVFTCWGLIDVLAAVIIGMLTLIKSPVKVFNAACNEELAVRANTVTPVSHVRGKIATWITVFATFLSAWFIPAFMDRSTSSLSDATATNILSSQALVIIVDVIIGLALVAGVALSIILGVIKATKDDAAFAKAKETLVHPMAGGYAVALFGWVYRWVITSGTSYILSGTNAWFNGPSIGTIAYWAIASGMLSVLFLMITHFFVKKVNFGLKAKASNVISGLISAIVVCGVACGFVWLINIIFKTDFRVYTYAIKTVNASAFVSSLRYLPFFFIFYLCAGMNVAALTTGKKGLKADLLAAIVETAPVALFLVYQYVVLETTGTAPFPNFALNGILAQGLVITLIALAIYQRRTYAKTGSIWAGVFLNTIFFTFITVANTTLYSLS